MELKEFFYKVWISQIIVGLVFTSAGLLALYNFIQVDNPETFADLMVTLMYIVIIVNILSFTGLILFDYESFKNTSTSDSATEELILIVFCAGCMGYFLMVVPMLLWAGIFFLIEQGKVGLYELSGLTKMYIGELTFVLLIIGIIFILIWFFQKITSVFEFTIIKRNKKIGESNNETDT